MAGQTFISELRAQLQTINEMLQEIEDRAYKGAFSPKYLPKDKTLYQELVTLRKEVRLKIARWKLQK